MNLKSVIWKEYYVEQVFECSTTSALDINDAVPGDIPYITRSALNNGLTGYYGNSSKSVEGNCITVGAEGAVAFYQKESFIPGIKIYTLRNSHLNEYNALFIVSILNASCYLYSYGRARILNKLKREKIKLPTKNNSPDWDFMEEYIKSLRCKYITTKNESNSKTLDLKSWKDFKLGDLFTETYKAKSHAKQNMMICEVNDKKAIPFVTRTEENNACDCFVYNYDLDGIEDGNAIVIGDTTATISYQANRFVTGDHIVVCRAEWINKYTALFVKSVLEKERYRYSYGRAFKKDLILSTVIKLPATQTKEGIYIPDYDYMEDYIKALPYGDRI